MPPCGYFDNHDDERDNGAATYKRDANKATRAACDLRTIIRRYNPDIERFLTKETRAWIKKHDDEDAERIAKETANGIREKTKQRALSKLTMDERRVLGL